METIEQRWKVGCRMEMEMYYESKVPNALKVVLFKDWLVRDSRC
jgi:hypothetical protein